MSITDNLSRLYPVLMKLGTAPATIYINEWDVSIQSHSEGLTDMERVLRWRGLLDVLSQSWQFRCARYKDGGGNVQAYVTVNDVPFRVWTAFDDLDGIADHLPISTVGLYERQAS